MRRIAGWFLLVTAVLCLLVGAVSAVVLGPDDRFRADQQPLGTDAPLVVTGPGALAWSGPAVEIEAVLPDDGSVFVGLGNAVDVSDYTEGVAALVVESIDVPLDLQTAAVEGEPMLPASPESLDWWLDADLGSGAATLSTRLPTTPAQVVVVALEGASLEGLEVAVTYELDGGFGIGLGLVGLAIGLALFGWICLRRPPDEWDEPMDAEVERPAATADRPDASGAVLSVLVVVTAVVLAGCAVPRPVDTEPVKSAVTRSEADVVVARWAERRAVALQALDSDPLTAVESGPTLAVDRGALAVARRLIRPGSQDFEQQLELRTVVAPQLSAYPLWFVAVVDDIQRGLTKLQVHERTSAAGPWQLVATAEVLPATQLPDLALDSASALQPVAADNDSGLAASPQALADAYAALLDDPDSPGDELVLADSFVAQMRTVTGALQELQGVSLSQSWQAEPVEWAARTADGGAIVFATMARKDVYRIRPGTTVNWTEGSEQAALLGGESYRTAELRYRHQVLLYVPPTGAGQTRALGQYGGVVAADIG